MKRLTPRKEYRNNIRFSNDWQINEICKKCGELEDIEEKYEFSLLIYHKALKNGIWHKEGNLIEPVYDVCLDRKGLFFPYIDLCGNLNQIRFLPEDFNITWALKKEKLEEASN